MRNVQRTRKRAVRVLRFCRRAASGRASSFRAMLREIDLRFGGPCECGDVESHGLRRRRMHRRDGGVHAAGSHNARDALCCDVTRAFRCLFVTRNRSRPHRVSSLRCRDRQCALSVPVASPQRERGRAAALGPLSAWRWRARRRQQQTVDVAASQLGRGCDARQVLLLSARRAVPRR